MFRKPHFLLCPLLPSLRRYDFLSLHSDVKRVLELLWPPKKTLTAALVLCATSKKSFLPSSDRVLKETAYISISGGLADFDRKSIPQSISYLPSSSAVPRAHPSPDTSLLALSSPVLYRSGHFWLRG